MLEQPPAHEDAEKGSGTIQGSKTPFERIVGGTDAEKKAVLEQLQYLFEERSEELSKYEIEKTPEDRDLIKRTETIVDDIVKRYGGDPKDFPLDHVYVMRKGSISEMSGGMQGGGIHRPLGSKIGVEKENSRFLFASTVAHELFHAKSPKVAFMDPDGDAQFYGSGLSMVDRKDKTVEIGKEKIYFDALEEAIVAECTKRFLERISGQESFREESEAVKKIWEWVSKFYSRSGMPEETIQWLGDELKFIADPVAKLHEVEMRYADEGQREAYAAGMIKRLNEQKDLEWMERRTEREMMYKVCDEIAAKSDGKFKNRDEVFEQFAKANFTGHYLSLGRMVESILGKGSFRTLADQFASEAEKEGEKGYK